jgi:hypothetical protein
MSSIKKKKRGVGGGDQCNFMQEDMAQYSGSGKKSGGNSDVPHDDNQGRKKVQNTGDVENVMQMEVSHQKKWDSEVQQDGTKAYSEGELMEEGGGGVKMEGRGDEPASPEAEQLRELAGIPEVKSPTQE